MKCETCNVSMLLSKSETSGSSTAEWYECPCCNRSRLTTRREPASGHMLSRSDSKQSGFRLSEKLSSFVHQ